MDEDFYTLLDNFDDDTREPAASGRNETSQYAQTERTLLQPRFRQPVRPVPPRDRYRAPRRRTEYDVVEDEGAYGAVEDEGMVFDEFDENLLREPFEDRQKQAVEGRARILLPPQPFNGFVPSGHRGLPQQNVRRDLAQYAYNATQLQEPSSDVQMEPSSSPAFKAGQRRVGNSDVGIIPHTPVSKRNKEPPFKARHSQQILQSSQHQLSAPKPPRRGVSHTTAPVIQGIPLVPVSQLPDRFRAIFPFPAFNAVQSRCFDNVYRSDNNFVLASPTGSGKTVILELAICRAVATNATGQYKIVYQAPTKALCSERQRDWEKKFCPLGLNCVELTGDSDASDLRNVQSANIIVTTPEKWDSITRKWKDHEKLMRLINLFLIDEVHILKEDRGATLEAVVSRMKSIGTNVRFVALSATVPNFSDVATWLGRSSANPYEPAINEKFGEEFRPVKLRKHICGFQCNSNNDFVFEKVLDGQLPNIVKKYSEGKPIMVFCFTRNSTVTTAKLLANWWTSQHPRDRAWGQPNKALTFQNKDLRDCTLSGVAFHHAGLDAGDRINVEKAFLAGDISVICCTSTLAVGVNLPCQFVIIKNTVTFSQGMVQEYSDLEIMQMLGRAGRPQFDDSAVAVILTRQNKVRKYEMMVTGKDLLESTLHLNLIDHLNAEIGLGTIRDLVSARKWLDGTFLYVRLKQNPAYYKLEGARSGQNIDEQLDEICFKSINLLQDNNLTTGEEYFRCTEFGHAMARYYVHFQTMRILMGLQPKASISEILSAIAQASEFEDIRFRAGEKNLYKFINRSPYIRFPIQVNLDLPAHKVSLLIQSVLGAADIAWDGDFLKHKTQYNTEAMMIFKQVSRLIRCIIDCQICLGDSVSINHALSVERSLAARVWDDSPLQMKQIEGLGVVSVRKLASAGIRSIEELEYTDAHRIDTVIGKNPPFGLGILNKLKSFPKLRVSLHLETSTITKTSEGVKAQVKADIGFINDKPPESFGSKLVYVCLLAETSDDRKIHFARISSKKLGKGQTIVFLALMTSPNLSINCYLMCDGIAGTLRSASITPKIASSMFPTAKPPESAAPLERPTSNMCRRRTDTAPVVRRPSVADEFDDGIDDDELVKASFRDLDFDHIENYANPMDTFTRKNTAKNASTKDKGRRRPSEHTPDEQDNEPTQLENGKWACNHKCKDKTACKHFCCKEGIDKPQKKSSAKNIQPKETGSRTKAKGQQEKDKTQTKLQLTASKRKASSTIEELDLTQKEKKKRKAEYARNGPKDYRDLHKLHESIQKRDPPSTISSVMHTKPAYNYGEGGHHALSFLGTEADFDRPTSTSDYGDIQLEDFSDDLNHFESTREPPAASTTAHDSRVDSFMEPLVDYSTMDHQPEAFDDDDSIFGDAIVGIADSEELRAANNDWDEDIPGMGDVPNMDYDQDMNLPDEEEYHEEEHTTQCGGLPTSSTVNVPLMLGQKGRSLFLNDTNSPRPTGGASNAAGPKFTRPALGDLMGPKNEVKNPNQRLTCEYEHEHLDVSPHQPPTPADQENVLSKEQSVPDAYKDLEPWFFQEFGDIVELVDE